MVVAKSQSKNIAKGMEAIQKTIGTKQSRVRIYDPRKEKMVSVAPYSANAKRLYKFYIRQLGYDPSWIAPPDLKWYPKSDRFVKMKKKTTMPVIEQRYSYKPYLAALTLHNLDKLPGNKGIELIKKFEPTLREYMRKHGGIKYHISSRCLVKKTLNGKTIQELDDFFITTFTAQIINESEIQNSLKADIQCEIDDIPERETRGSGYVFDRVITHEIQLAKYEPLKGPQGSHYLKLPDNLKAKRAIINVQNKDDKCFMWAVLSALYPADKHADRVSIYKESIEKHNWAMLDFPVPVNQIAKFEKRNNLSINVYGWDEKSKAPHLLGTV
jgi:hypothetical protein